MDLIVLAIPVFVLLIGIELVFVWIAGKDYYRLSDTLSDLSCGILDQVVGVFLKTAAFAGYVFSRFAPGFDAGVHSHTSDLRIVVIKGAYLYRADGKETRVGPGDFLFIPGGTKHWSGGDAKDGALFYQDGLGKFDIVPVK